MPLPQDFPLRHVFEQFLEDFALTTTYWYLPKARAINANTVQVLKGILELLDSEFYQTAWTVETQNLLLDQLAERGLHQDRVQGQIPNDRAAGARILLILLQTLGFAYLDEDSRRITITDAGLSLILTDTAAGSETVVASQIAKHQYPNPLLKARYAPDFHGLVGHLFLLQVLSEVGNRVSNEEMLLFLNLAQGHDDVSRVARYIEAWRSISDEHREELLEVVQAIPMATPQVRPQFDPPEPETSTRFTRISNTLSYQKSFFGFAPYLSAADGLICTDPSKVKRILEEQLEALAVPRFRNVADWIAYFGDPDTRPSWYEYLLNEIEAAESKEVAEDLVKEHREHLEESEVEALKHRQVEKAIESFYVSHLDQIEAGLTLVDGGRQYSTPIGRIDLLCRGQAGEYVVVEIKADEARDSVFGQLLRYLGWVHLNLEGGHNNVRGIILAGGFSDKARYSRIGLLKANAEEQIRFVKHGFRLETA